MKKLAILVALLAMLAPAPHATGGELPQMTVYKTPWCGCCGKWVDHMKAAGFEVDVKSVEDLATVKRLAGIPEGLQACHTAKVGGYTVEGHVPADDVKRLLAKKPKVEGLAVPGMPSGSPGMENGEHDPYDVVAFTRDGKTEVFASHK